MEMRRRLGMVVWVLMILGFVPLWAIPQPDVVGYWRIDLRPGYNLVAFPLLPDTPTRESVFGEPPATLEVAFWDEPLRRFRACTWDPVTRRWEGDLYLFHCGMAYWIWWGGAEPWPLVVVGRPEIDVRFRWNKLGLGWKYFAPIQGEEIPLQEVPPLDPRDLLLTWDPIRQLFLVAWGTVEGWASPFFSRLAPDAAYLTLLNHPPPRLVGPPEPLEALYQDFETAAHPLPIREHLNLAHPPPRPLVIGNRSGGIICYPDGSPCGGDFRVEVIREMAVYHHQEEVSIEEELITWWDYPPGSAPQGRFNLALTVGSHIRDLHVGDRLYLRVLTRRGEETRSQTFLVNEEEWLIDDLRFLSPLTSTKEKAHLPQVFSVSTPFPNPFNQRFQITVALPSPEIVKVQLFTIDGRKVWELSEPLSGGEHRFAIKPDPLSSGVYLLQVTAPSGAKSFKLALIR